MGATELGKDTTEPVESVQVLFLYRLSADWGELENIPHQKCQRVWVRILVFGHLDQAANCAA
jgi:hypothetical protein